MKNISLISSILLVGLLSACGQKKVAQAPVTEDIPVRVEAVATQSVAVPVVASGIIAAKKEAKLAFKTGGIVARLLVEEGQTVRKGQLLASLNLTEISAQASQARNNQEKARRDLDRVKRLYADSAATFEQLQNATTGYEVASSGLNIAEFNLQYSQIYAPGNGRILKRYVEEGELVSASASVFLFAASDAGNWVIRVGVADRDMVRIQLGDAARVQLDAYPDTDFAATISEIAPTADPRSGTFEVELRVDPKGKVLASGMVAKVSIQPAAGPTMPVIPIEALVEADGSNGYVYALNADRHSVKKIPVKVGQLLGNSVVISEGIRANDTIVTDGVAYLTNDSKVKVVQQPTVVSR